jgi:hypothetical protein
LKVLVNAMKLFSVGVHCYPIGHLSWTDYAPRKSAEDPPSYKMTLYGERVKLTPLPIAIPATISYLGIAETLEKRNELSAIGNNLGDTEWNRVFGLIDNDLSKVHKIGSLEGVWEGAFTVGRIRIHKRRLTLLSFTGQYTDFTGYSAFLRGSSSSVVVNTPFARHRQTFKAREYVVFEPTALRVGDTLHAFLPAKPTIKETLSGVEIEGVEYLAVAGLSEEQKEGKTVQDVVVLGEVTIYQAPFSPSCSLSTSTGTFLMGTISYLRSRETVRRFSLPPQRLCAFPHGLPLPTPLSDALFLPRQMEDDRGTWLYRGYHIGDADGTIVGRWRDTFSLPVLVGYEGSFTMTRRK